MLNLEGESLQIDTSLNVIYNQEINTLDLSSLTLKQKIAQMIITYGKESNLEYFQKMLIGGIYLDAKKSEGDYQKIITKFQEKAVIPFFVTVDLEGCINPFENFHYFPSFNEIKDKEEAFQVGKEAGQVLRKLGFTTNFAPVADLEDLILHCRSFHGSAEEVRAKTVSYLSGLQEQGIMAVAKHYPGKTLAGSDSHEKVVKARITEEDLLPFHDAISNNVSAIMISHVIVEGEIDSSSLPATISSKVVESVKDKFEGLIITDEVGMLGLAANYPAQEVNRMFVDLFKAGNDLVLNFDRRPLNIYRMINTIEKAVRTGELNEERIDNSVRKILQAKGINVVG